MHNNTEKYKKNQKIKKSNLNKKKSDLYQKIWFFLLKIMIFSNPGQRL